MMELLAKLFPPEIEHLHPKEDLPDTLDYHYRLSRTGCDPHPNYITGVQIVNVVEGPPAPKLVRGRVIA